MEPDSTDDYDIRRFEEQLRRNPDSLVFARFADACRKAGDPRRALSILQEGIRRHPDYASAHIVRARALEDLDRHAEAEASLRRVLELDAQNLVAMRGLAGLAERRGDPVEAVHWFEQIVAHDPTNDEAADALERLRKTLPETPPGLEPLPAPREEWWSSPAFEIVDEGPDEAEVVEELAGEREDEPSDEEQAEVTPDVVDPEPGAEAAPEANVVSADETSEPADSRRGGGAWWFEDPAGSDAAEEDGDLLTRTMAELYVKQGLVEEAAAIYRELLADRPDDEELRRALAGLEADVGDAAGIEPAPAASSTPEENAAGQEAPAHEKLPEDGEPAVGDESSVAGESPGHGVESPGADGPAPAAEEAEVAAAPADAYASHPVPTTAAESAMFRDWIRRLRE